MNGSGGLHAVRQGLVRQILGMSPVPVGSSVTVQPETELSTWQPQGPKPGHLAHPIWLNLISSGSSWLAPAALEL